MEERAASEERRHTRVWSVQVARWLASRRPTRALATIPSNMWRCVTTVTLTVASRWPTQTSLARPTWEIANRRCSRLPKRIFRWFSAWTVCSHPSAGIHHQAEAIVQGIDRGRDLHRFQQDILMWSTQKLNYLTIIVWLKLKAKQYWVGPAPTPAVLVWAVTWLPSTLRWRLRRHWRTSSGRRGHKIFTKLRKSSWKWGSSKTRSFHR